MATKEQIVTAILETAGNPAVGVVRDLAEAFADAIIAIDTPAKEVRVVETKETRQLFPFLATAPLGLFPSPSGVFFHPDKVFVEREFGQYSVCTRVSLNVQSISPRTELPDHCEYGGEMASVWMSGVRFLISSQRARSVSSDK